MYLKLLLITVVLLGISFALFAIKILVVKGGKFPNTHIGGNKNMAKRGIFCATSTDKIDRKEAFKLERVDLK